MRQVPLTQVPAQQSAVEEQDVCADPGVLHVQMEALQYPEVQSASMPHGIVAPVMPAHAPPVKPAHPS